MKFSKTGFRSIKPNRAFPREKRGVAFFRATKIRLPFLPLSLCCSDVGERFNRATTRVSIQFRATVHRRPTVSLVFLVALQHRNFFQGSTAVLPRDLTVDLTALLSLSLAVSIYPSSYPSSSLFSLLDRREREREHGVPVSHPRRRRFPLLAPSSLYSSFFRSSSPWATWSRSSRYGNRAESRWELTPSLFSLSLIFYRGPPVFLSLPLFVTYSTRILPPFLSLSLSLFARAPIFL